MSYSFRSGLRYRMPTHFGPSLGPRQGPGGRRYDCERDPKQLIVRAGFKARTSQLADLLPPGFEPDEPANLYVTFCYLTEVQWLAGRGYNTFGVSLPAVYRGRRETASGELLLVLWENMADPIITGREELGFSKVYCELPEPQFVDDDVVCRASWDGCQFAALRVTGLNEIAAEALPAAGATDGLLHYKYIPRTGAPGEADAEYPVLTPATGSHLKVEQAMKARDAACVFRESTWDELPTLVHIVNALSALSWGECVEATVLRTRGAKDLGDQRVLE
ncbi:MAG: acetoacetate decarboxylase family protein [Steroidobacteraceae bacterium]